MEKKFESKNIITGEHKMVFTYKETVHQKEYTREVIEDRVMLHTGVTGLILVQICIQDNERYYFLEHKEHIRKVMFQEAINQEYILKN